MSNSIFNLKGKSILPIEVLLEIYEYLSPEDVVSVTATSKEASQKSSVYPDYLNQFWKNKFKQHFPHSKIDQCDNWYVLFKETYQKEYSSLHKTPSYKPIFSLVKEGDIEALRKKIESGELKFEDFYHPDIVDINGFKLLTWAPNQATLDFFYEFAVKHFSDEHGLLDVSRFDNEMGTILHWAVACRQPAETIKELIEVGLADVNSQANTRQFSPLHVMMLNNMTPADETRDQDIIGMLVQKGCNTEARNSDNLTAITLAINRNTRPHLFQALLGHGANINVVGGVNNDTLLHGAAYYNHTRAIEALVEKGLAVDTFNSAHVTPLYCAASRGNQECITLLKEKGADINIIVPATTALHNCTLVYHAIKLSDSYTLNSLLENGANANAVATFHGTVDSFPVSPLYLTVFWNKEIEMIESLLKHGADTKFEAIGCTPLECHTSPFSQMSAWLASKEPRPDVVALIKKYQFIIHPIQEILGEKERPPSEESLVSFSFSNPSIEDEINKIINELLQSDYQVITDSYLKLNIKKLMLFVFSDENKKILEKLNKGQLVEIIEKLDEKDKHEIFNLSVNASNQDEIESIDNNDRIKLIECIMMLEEKLRSSFVLFNVNDRIILGAAKKLEKWLDGKKVHMTSGEVDKLQNSKELSDIYSKILDTAFYTKNSDKLVIIEGASVSFERRRK